MMPLEKNCSLEENEKCLSKAENVFGALVLKFESVEIVSKKVES